MTTAKFLNNNNLLAQFPTTTNENSNNNTRSAKTGFNIGGKNVSRIAEKFQNLPQNVSMTTEPSQQSQYNFSKPFTTTVSTYGIASNLMNNRNKELSSSKWEHYDNNLINSKLIENDPMVRLRSILKEHSPLQQQRQILVGIVKKTIIKHFLARKFFTK